MLKKLLSHKKNLFFIEAHSPLSAHIIDSINIPDNDGFPLSFDGIWSSSLSDSVLNGLPDTEYLDLRSRIKHVHDMMEFTSKPIIFDADTGGDIPHFEKNIRMMERIGISAVIIEDKTGQKKNSLFGNSVYQQLEDINVFSEKIMAGKKSLKYNDLQIFARIESLIAGMPMDDALIRAERYVHAGADGIMIHSCKRNADEVICFAHKFRKKFPFIPLVCVPTTYSDTPPSWLFDAGFNIIIYANHLIRSSYKAMEDTAIQLLRTGMAADVESKCVEVKKILSAFE
ncbi:Phosphonopyruvate hydrolase [Marinomonas spartinae]|uniref:phosphoenolpyruvate mutase n=1 Tax=Marinomonas spartinae TaxID=1792290 RepID=UPI000808F0C0|nr:phosphoenolpyruvate mutase [Marinomonas spartinae]SBS39155.1 Phosphonopyruvate hydrolase [Marinomonas spartinae]